MNFYLLKCKDGLLDPTVEEYDNLPCAPHRPAIGEEVDYGGGVVYIVHNIGYQSVMVCQQKAMKDGEVMPSSGKVSCL